MKDTDIVCFRDGSSKLRTKNGDSRCSSFRLLEQKWKQLRKPFKQHLVTEIEFHWNMWVMTDSLSAITALYCGPVSQNIAIGSGRNHSHGTEATSDWIQTKFRNAQLRERFPVNDSKVQLKSHYSFSDRLWHHGDGRTSHKLPHIQYKTKNWGVWARQRH